MNTTSVSTTAVKSNRCTLCRKKLSVPVDCRCGLYFCSEHRMPYSHQCTAFKREHQEKLTVQLMSAKSLCNKLERI